ncbi:cysteine-rich repeat secretory protein 15-like [Senna tora]|uniref:Cysteine-rich repeat secretory protein 15-like n=1 Tax=Senna tora TaxID=362788 RepID=A0A834XJ81_9FABA|nr:cysteine-rich repeat secretory protein 15-like [Senna tora]
MVPIDCKTCIETSLQQIGLVCPYSFGASLQLEGCSLRYEHVDFLGKVDVSVRYKRCRRPVSRHDHEFFWRRDRVVADLAGRPGGGGFRVSRSGFVEGYSECVGDLSTEDCSSCVVEAVRRLKGLCGSAAKGDVFLGKCYARYWASGYDEETPDSLKEDQVRKATAIIVGLLASLVILIAILSICQRAMGKK